jgi:hypothetical protein
MKESKESGKPMRSKGDEPEANWPSDVAPVAQPMKAGMQEDVFSLSEGRAVIQWPTPLSAESIQDLKDWLKLVERKITRSKKSKDETEK